MNSVGTYDYTCVEGSRIGSDGKTCISLDADKTEEEEELELVRFPGLLFKSPPQLLPDVATALPTAYTDEDEEDRKRIFENCIKLTVPRGSMELAALQNVSVWRRTPWNAVPKMAVAPANLVTKATDARKPGAPGASSLQLLQCHCPGSLPSPASTVIAKFVHQAHMGRTVNRYVSVQLRMKSVTQSQGDIPVFLATMETAVISDAQEALTI
ncbi:uncharacterized protein LOC121033961 isoform X2 [Herpailurus yagouaroundi]|uniref:uncharacterized protein LOC121033961 isoform X2 n=1 Tax=Herpailurus yagouaroundi TaxID=1608482 RepID=UPI001AD6A8A3|nr:uncharacterized protein LOC121033961 isoform X2 [Puma yagouaroundi]XP_040336624.1 uncharacterized protein LOC121033961 isoform X2 [Puma yagouaroundi]